MKVNEIFYSIQGEIDVGKPTIFIRLQGCNMEPKCIFCDSSYSWNEGKEMSNDEIYREIKPYLEKCQYIVFTGGEPMIQSDDITKLVLFLDEKRNDICCGLETNGTIYNQDIFMFNNISVSPKKQMIDLDVLNQFNQNNVRFKFVYDKDLWFEKVIKDLDLEPWQVWIMAEGMTKQEQEEKIEGVVEYCKEKGYNFTLRLHTLTWGNKRAK